MYSLWVSLSARGSALLRPAPGSRPVDVVHPTRMTLSVICYQRTAGAAAGPGCRAIHINRRVDCLRLQYSSTLRISRAYNPIHKARTLIPLIGPTLGYVFKRKECDSS